MRPQNYTATGPSTGNAPVACPYGAAAYQGYSSGQKMVVPFELMEPDVVDDSALWPRHKEESYHPDIG